LPNEQLVGAAERELFEEIGRALTVDDLILLSGSDNGVPSPVSDTHNVYIYVDDVHVPYMTANLRTSTKVEQLVLFQLIVNLNASYVVPATGALDG
jgi:8-oxo-dGTP pyrophosphatase MutT (NUDIX family)